MKLSKTARRIAIGSMLGASVASVSATALAAFQAHISIKGKKQGQFKGESLQDKRKDKWMGALSVTFGIKSPRDVATGQASGKRQWEGICFTKEAGAATPQILSAVATNEVLPEVVFEFTKTNPNGEEYVFQTIKLTDATISSAKQRMGDVAAASTSAKRSTTVDSLPVDDVCFTFRKIEVDNKDGKTMFMDDWTAM